MIISVASIRKGSGQTTAAVNIAASTAVKLSERVLIIDANQGLSDIDYYLSDGRLTRGIDDFVSLQSFGLLNIKNMERCVKSIHKHIDIMASSNSSSAPKPEHFRLLLEYALRLYSAVFLDIGELSDDISHYLFNASDIVVVVLSQTRKCIQHFIDSIARIQGSRARIILIVNRYISRIDGLLVDYSLSSIIQELKLAGMEQMVFTLPFDAEVLNESNSLTLLNLMLNPQNRKNRYVKSVNKITGFLLEKAGKKAVNGKTGIAGFWRG